MPLLYNYCPIEPPQGVLVLPLLWPIAYTVYSEGGKLVFYSTMDVLRCERSSSILIASLAILYSSCYFSIDHYRLSRILGH